MKIADKTLEKFKEIRKKLDDLNYKHHFDTSNMQLIEALIIDLTRYSKENSNLASQNLELKSLNENFKINQIAYKSENNQLVKENNNLHREFIESKKKNFSSSNSKEIEIKKLSEEKDSFKFLFLNAKEKLEKIQNENEELKKRHLNIISNIYESNMSEKSLRKLYELSENILDSKIINKNNSYNNENSTQSGKNKIELGIFARQRGITGSSSSNLGMNLSSKSFIQSNNQKSILKDAIEETFGKRENIEEIKNSSRESMANEEKVSQSMNLNFSQSLNFFKFGEMTEKIKILESENEILNKENNRVNKTISEEKVLSEDNSKLDLKMTVEYLKKERIEIIEKYEKRIEFLLKNDKVLLKLNYRDTNNSEKNKNKSSLKKINTNIDNPNTNTKSSECQISELLKMYRTENFSLKDEKEILKSKIKILEDESNKISSNNEEIFLLSHNLSEYRRIVSEMNSNIKLTSSTTNSEKNLLSNQIVELKEQNILLDSKIKENLKIIQEKSKEISDLEDQVIFLNSKILSKEETIIQITEKIEKASEHLNLGNTQQEKVKIEKKLREIQDDYNKLRKENILNLSELYRLKNINIILEKHSEILEIKLQNMN